MALQTEGQATVPLSMVEASQVSLRGVDKESEKYLGLVESIKTRGFLSTITVRPMYKTDEDGNIVKEYYEVKDGLHRYSAAVDAGLTEINVLIKETSDGDTLEEQIMMNVHRVETKPCEYAEQLRRIMDLHPTWTVAELAAKIGKSTKWIDDILGLNRIESEPIRQMVNEGKIKLSNAYALSSLPVDEQDANLEDAQVLPAAEFMAKCLERKKEIAAAKRAGKDAPAPAFTPVPYLRKMSDLKREAFEGLPTIGTLINPNMAASEAATLALKWALNMDDATIEAQKQEFEKKQEAKKELAAKRSASKGVKDVAKAERKAEVANRRAQAMRKLAMGEITQEQYDEELKVIAEFEKSPIEVPAED